ncbi:probable protein phosphatase 2C 6 isoform X2 [Diospyros lotus]|uniref:probable protein phosphatase 2C 6 isoform X2 n=2 Tax=Diospyros lotus TaxID=55363 RepID=UPI002256B71C|nr:probable protein phosphatase 2C 6 isoform X2 [Diospyros lotus]
MGICYSSIGRKRTTAQKEASLDAKFQKSCSGDFSSFIGKFGGGGGAAADERALLQIPGRLFASGSSKIASLYTQQGKKGTNQDAMIVWENFGSRSDTVFCGVFDGHGPYGHMVAKKVRDCLPILLASQWEANSNNDRNEDGNATRSTNFEECTDEELCEPLEVEENKKFPEMHQPLKKSMLKAFKLMDKELRFHPIIDCYCSGTTAVTLVKQGQDLIIGNVGDSRAVLATRDKEDALTAEQLTIDLKPNLPREAARIQQYKGRVFALQDEPEVARVWLPNSDSPGLAMARAFGDFCLKDFGLISVPDVYYHQLTEKDEFIVLASDGVWDVLSNKEAVDVVASAPTRATAARALVDCATRAWRLKYPTSKIDDCAVVCLFLEHVPAAAEAEAEAAPAEAAAVSRISVINGDLRSSDNGGISASHVSVTERSTTTLNDSGEIVPVPDSTEEKHPQSGLGQSKRSLAECLSNAEDEEWSALEGITRVNSLLSIPRFLSGDKRSASWRKWL